MEDLILVGRGDSVKDFDWSAHNGTPIGAVSSGVFVKQLPRKPDHWFVIDPPRYFIGENGSAYKKWKYFLDDKVEWWDICNDPNVETHTPKRMA